MRLRLMSIINTIKENRSHLLLMVGVFAAIMSFDFYLTNRLLEGLMDQGDYVFQTTLMLLASLIFLGVILVRLNLANEKALAENRAKNSFLAIMSHEIRTPLNAIVGLGQLEIKNKSLSTSSKNVIEKILMSGQNLLTIVNDILDLSKIESRKFEMARCEYDIPNLVNDVSVISRSRIASKPIEFRLSLSPDIPCKFIGDVQRIKQILNNFLNNAIKQTESGFISLSVNYLYVNEAPCLKFEISDSSPGMKLIDISNLFNVEKVGLELLIAKKLADVMGSTIEVSSVYGEGSKYSLCIPQKAANEGVAIGPSVVASLEKMKYGNENVLMSKDFAVSKLTGAKVLIVDDVQMNIDVMKSLLELYELSIDTATSGQQAIDMLKHGNKYDIIFMDHMMPVMDGIEATRIIRSFEGDYFKNAAIVAFTANALAGSDKMFLENGFDDFMSKPVDIHSLDNCLNKWVKKRAQSVRPPGHSQVLERYVNIAEGSEQFGSAEIFKKMLGSFKKHTPDLLERLREQSGNDYIISIHALKGCVRTIFAKELGDRAYELENAAKNDDWKLVKSKNDSLLKDVQDLIDAISTD